MHSHFPAQKNLLDAVLVAVVVLVCAHYFQIFQAQLTFLPLFFPLFFPFLPFFPPFSLSTAYRTEKTKKCHVALSVDLTHSFKLFFWHK